MSGTTDPRDRVARAAPLDRERGQNPLVPRLVKVDADLQEAKRLIAASPDPAAASLLRVVEGLVDVVRVLAASR